MTAFFLDRFMAVAQAQCTDAGLDAAAESFRTKLQADIEAGRAVGQQMASTRGQQVLQVAEQMARRQVEQAVRAQGQAAACASMARDITARKDGSIDDLLRLGYESWMREVGNRQGYPCDMVPTRADRVVQRFVQGGLDFSDDKAVARSMVAAETAAVLPLLGNCERAQLRAAEFHVTTLQDYASRKVALESIDQALRALGPERDARLAAAVEALKARAGPAAR